MEKYRRIVQSGRLVEVYEYQYHPSRKIRLCRKVDKNKVKIRNRRPDNVSRLSARFKRLVWANLSPETTPALLTLTFRDEQTIDTGYLLLGKFRRKLEKKFSGVKYIAVPEFGTKNTKRLHFHVLVWGFSDEIILSERSSRTLADMWGNGFIDIIKTDGSHKLGGYLAKYLAKALSDERLLFKKAYTTSRNILRSMSTNSPVVWSYRDDMWELSTTPPLQVRSYETQWLGRCVYSIYRI